MNKEFNGFDEMVEALEENEDMVECKECFDLVPKADCEKAEIGYICPVCKGLRTAPAQARFVDPYDSYTQDFPEVTEYDPDSIIEFEKEPGLGDALSDLIRDEYEAIDGYETADEKIQHADIDEDEKDEILDTLDHIKEEEEEHIDELKELYPECEPEKLEEASISDIAAAASMRAADLEDRLDYMDTGIQVEDQDTIWRMMPRRATKSWVVRRGKEVLGKVRATSLTKAQAAAERQIPGFDPECEVILEAFEEKLPREPQVDDGITSAAYESLTEEAKDATESPEEDIPEAEDSEENENEEVSDLDSAYEAALEIANESGVGQVFGYARKDTEEFVAIEPFEVDDPEAVEDDLMAVYDDVAYAYVAYPEKELEESLFESVQLNEVTGKIQRGWDALKNKARAGLRNVTKAALNIDDIFSKGYYVHIDNVPEDDMVDAQGNSLQDRTTDNLKDAERLAINISKRLPKAQVYLMGEDEGVEIEDRELKKLVVNKYAWKLARYRAGSVNNSAIEAINKRIRELELAGDNIDATSVGTRSSSLDRAKKAAKETLGTKLEPDEYTPESYRAYSASFDSIVSDISIARTVEDLEKLGVETLKKDAEKLLKKKTNNSTDFEDEDPNLDDDEDVVDPREKAKQVLGGKKAADGYTSDSYRRYEAAYNKIVAWLEAHTKPEALTPARIEGLKKQAEAKLVEVPDEDPNLEDEDDTPEPPADKTTDETEATEKDTDTDSDETTNESSDEDTTGTDTAGKVKLSEVSEEQLKKLFTAVTGRGVGDNEKWQKVLARMRAKLQELGESLDPQDYKAEDFIEEELSSEAEAIKSLKDTQVTLKSAADGIKNMTSAMREEYHKYANPAELKAMEDIENLVSVVLSNIYKNLATWGYKVSETDSQCWMSQENEACLQYMIDFEDLNDDESEDLADQLQVQLENELSTYKPVPEIEGIAGSIALPDYDIAYDDDDEDFEGITRASIMVYVTFARNLF